MAWLPGEGQLARSALHIVAAPEGTKVRWVESQQVGLESLRSEEDPRLFARPVLLRQPEGRHRKSKTWHWADFVSHTMDITEPALPREPPQI